MFERYSLTIEGFFNSNGSIKKTKTIRTDAPGDIRRDTNTYGGLGAIPTKS